MSPSACRPLLPVSAPTASLTRPLMFSALPLIWSLFMADLLAPNLCIERRRSRPPSVASREEQPDEQREAPGAARTTAGLTVASAPLSEGRAGPAALAT